MKAPLFWLVVVGMILSDDDNLLSYNRTFINIIASLKDKA